MKTYIHCVFDSYDSAYLASIKLKNSVDKIKIANITKNSQQDDLNRDNTIIAYGWPQNMGAAPYGTFYPSFPLYSSFVYTNVPAAENKIEPVRRSEVSMRVEAADLQTAKKVYAMLVNLGGREIHTGNSKNQNRII